MDGKNMQCYKKVGIINANVFRGQIGNNMAGTVQVKERRVDQRFYRYSNSPFPSYFLLFCFCFMKNNGWASQTHLLASVCNLKLLPYLHIWRIKCILGGITLKEILFFFTKKKNGIYPENNNQGDEGYGNLEEIFNIYIRSTNFGV